MLPYILSLLIGTLFGLLLFRDADFSIREVFNESLSVTAFQLGVFNNLDGARSLANKHDALIMKDDDVYRVYYSILTKKEVIIKMEEHLKERGINYYLRNITITDVGLIKAINEYETTMIEGNASVLVSVNRLITSSYEGEGI